MDVDFNLLIGSIQLAVAALQLKLDHFNRPANREAELGSFHELGHAIRSLEYALAETVAFVGQTNDREPNPGLASYWEEASRTIRNIDNGADLADLTFEKNLYWRNLEFYRGQSENNLYRISLGNVLLQLRQLRSKYEKLQNKINR